MGFVDIKAEIQFDLDRVNQAIESAVQDQLPQYVNKIMAYVLNNQGKQIRPTLSLLLFKSISQNRPLTEIEIKQIAAIELIHIGSLVHDDIIDDAKERRNQLTVHEVWNNKSAVATGTFLYAVAINLLCTYENTTILMAASETVRQMCIGELIQLSGREENKVSKSIYYDILLKKTGRLFGTTFLCSGVLANQNSTQIQSLQKMGDLFGVLFQLNDDYWDYFGPNPNQTKPIGQDFMEQQWTLPTLLLADRVADKSAIFSTPLNDIIDQLKSTQCDHEMKTIIRDYEHQIKKHLNQIDDTPFKEGFLTLLQNGMPT
jgi:octaprenyl-diphosphate synthase